MRWLFVHAHPDDETLSTGAIISCLVARGDTCLVLTATRGEMGEAVPGSVAPNEDLVAVREAERAQALRLLHAEDAGYLGTAPNRSHAPDRIYRDSGMTWLTPTLAGPSRESVSDSLYQADLNEVVADLVAAALSHGAEALVSYDNDGGYGHPDHVRCHQATQAAARAMGLPFFEIMEDSTLSTTWYEAPHPEALLAAHHAYSTQFTVQGHQITHVGGQKDKVRLAAGLHMTLP